MKPKLVMLIGIPGSGKSTWVKKKRFKYYIVSQDSIRKRFFGDISDQKNNTVVMAMAKGMVTAALELGKTVVLDATNVNTTYRREFLKDIPPCRLTAVLFDIDPSTAYKRIQSDLHEGKERSKVPESVVQMMHEDYLHTKMIISEEGFDEVVYV